LGKSIVEKRGGTRYSCCTVSPFQERGNLHSLGKNASVIAQDVDLGVCRLDLCSQLADLGHAGEVSSKAVDILIPTCLLDALGCISSFLLVPVSATTFHCRFRNHPSGLTIPFPLVRVEMFEAVSRIAIAN